MRVLRLLAPYLLIVISILVVLSLVVRKTVYLESGETRQAKATYALTVGGFLLSEGISLGPEDQILPGVDEWLKPDQVVVIERAAQMEILADGELHSLLTPERLPVNLLTLAGITLYPGDLLLYSSKPIAIDQPLPQINSPQALQVRRAISFTLHEGDLSKRIQSTASSLGEALWEAGILLYASDQLTPPPETLLTPGLEVILERSRPVTIFIGETQKNLRITAKTVGEALVKAGLAPQGLDYSQPEVNKPLPLNGEIRLVRVQEEVILEHTPLPFERVYQPVDDLDLDQQTILQSGEYGLEARRIRMRIEDGVEVSRQVEDEWVARQAKSRLIGYGTRVVMNTADTPDGPVQYWRALQMWATSYAPQHTGSDRTASGMTLRKGLVAVDTRYIPFLTRLYIPGYGEAIAADTGGGIQGRMIDLGYSNNDYRAWHEYVTVYFLWPPPENIVWIFP